MRRFTAMVVVRQPAEALFAAVRDRLPELVAVLDDVRAITEVDRVDVDPRTVRVVNDWRAEQRLPEVLARALGGSEVGWVDHAEYDADALTCRWVIEPSILTEHVTCVGGTVYEPAMAGRGTRVRVSGEFELAAEALGGVGRVFEGPVRAFVETLVTTMIPKNTRAMIEAAADLVADARNGGATSS